MCVDRNVTIIHETTDPSMVQWLRLADTRELVPLTGIRDCTCMQELGGRFNTTGDYILVLNISGTLAQLCEPE